MSSHFAWLLWLEAVALVILMIAWKEDYEWKVWLIAGMILAPILWSMYR